MLIIHTAAKIFAYCSFCRMRLIRRTIPAAGRNKAARGVPNCT
jgi:hypothetical protein